MFEASVGGSLKVLVALFAVLAGASFVSQSAVNASLRTSLRSASWAAFISYLGGTVTMAIVLLVRREGWINPGSLERSAWWAWTGGLFGAAYVVISILLLPRLGAAALLSLIVAGQMLASIVFDRTGLFGLTRHAVTPSRLVGALLLVMGVALICRK